MCSADIYISTLHRNLNILTIIATGYLNVFSESLNVPIIMISMMITMIMSMMMDMQNVNKSFIIFSLVVDVFNDHLILCGFP